MKNEAALSRWQYTEAQIGDEIRSIEERTMIARGVSAKKYSLYDVTRDIVSIGEKKLY
jgi:hypothetical protein